MVDVGIRSEMIFSPVQPGEEIEGSGRDSDKNIGNKRLEQESDRTKAGIGQVNCPRYLTC